jgi:hypothetical protein
MRAVLVCVVALAAVAVAAGVDCDAAERATASTCAAFGRSSQPCEVLRLHHTAKCVHVGDLGESAAPAPSAQEGLKATLKAEQQAASKGDIVETIRLANEVYDKAKAMCHCKAGVSDMPAAAATAPASEAPAQAAPEPTATAAAPMDKSLQGLEKKTGLSGGAAAALNAKVAKLESKDKINPDTQKVIDTPAEKAAEKEEQKAEAKTEVDTANIQMQEAIKAKAAEASARGDDPVAAAKKEKQVQMEKIAEKEAKKSGKADTSSEEIKAGETEVKAEGIVAERSHVGRMMGSLPPGSGLRSAFTKIEAANVKPEKGDTTQEVLKQAEKIEGGKATAETKAHLSKEARGAVNALEAEEEKNKQPSKADSKLEKEEQKIESTKEPGDDGSDKVMYGSSSDKLDKHIAGAQPPQNAMNKAGEDAKKAEEMEQVEAAENAGTGGSLTELDDTAEYY